MLSGLVIPAAYLTLPLLESSSDKLGPSRIDAEDGENGQPGPAQRSLKITWESSKIQLIRFDVLGICLGVPGLLLLTYALTSGNISGWGSPSIVSTLVVASILLIFFVYRECRASQALINPKLFDSSFSLTLALAVVTNAVRQACAYFLTLQLQSYGNSPLHTSVLFLPMGVSVLIANSIAGRLVPVLGARIMFILGSALCIPSMVLFSLITEESSYWRFTFPGMILYIAGLGVVYTTANFVVVSSASKSDQGAVAAVFNVFLQVGGSICGLAVLTAMSNSIDRPFGTHSGSPEMLSPVGYKSVYYSCLILSFVALLISLLCVRVPEAIRGSIWNKRLPLPSTVEAAAPEHELSQAIEQQADCVPPASANSK